MKKILTAIFAAALGLGAWGAPGITDGVTDNPAVAIGSTGYATLADAIAVVPADGTATTITMIADEAINSNAGVTIPAGKNVVLDLNGKTITGVVQSATTAQTILNKGTLVITDSSDGKNGKITNVVSDENAGSPMAKNWASNVIRNEGNGNLTVNAGNIINTGNGGACYAIDNYGSGKVTINGGTLDAAKASAIRMFNNNGGKVTVTGGTIGHYTSDSDCSYMGIQVQIGSNADIDISGGDIAGMYAVYSGAEAGDSAVSISGGTFDGYVGIGSNISEDNISISGGTFLEWVGTWGDQTGFISGGNFGYDVDEEYLAEGYKRVENGDNYIVVPNSDSGETIPCVTNMVVSANLFGALTVNAGSATNAFVAVPFGAFDIGDVKIAAADVVQAATLSVGDKMYVWNGAEGTSQQYDVYEVKNGVWTVAKKVTVAANGSQSEGSTSPDSHLVDSGTGIFIERKDTSKPIYVYGQVLTNMVAETAFGAGLTLVSAPSTNAMAQINFNALAWTGVKPVTITTTTSGRKIVTSYANADFIYYRNTANRIVRLYYDGTKWGTVSGTWKDAGDEAKIPAGTAFWYMNNGSASVRWQ